MTLEAPLVKAPVVAGRRAAWGIMAVTGLAGVVFAVLALRWPTYEAEFQELAQTEARGIEVWQSIATEAQAGRLTDPEAADRINRELLPVWKEARAQVAKLQAGWGDRLPKQLPDAFRLRQEAWEAMAAGARGDRAQAVRAREAWAEADRLVAEIHKGGKG